MIYAPAEWHSEKGVIISTAKLPSAIYCGVIVFYTLSQMVWLAATFKKHPLNTRTFNTCLKP